MLLQSDRETTNQAKRRPLWTSRKSLVIFLLYLSGFLSLTIIGGFLVEISPAQEGISVKVDEGWEIRPADQKPFRFSDPVLVRHLPVGQPPRTYGVEQAAQSLRLLDDPGPDLNADSKVIVVFRALKIWQFLRLGLNR